MAQRPLTAELGLEPTSFDLRPLSFWATSSPPSLVPAWPSLTQTLVPCVVAESPSLCPSLCQIGNSLNPG